MVIALGLAFSLGFWTGERSAMDWWRSSSLIVEAIRLNDLGVLHPLATCALKGWHKIESGNFVYCVPPPNSTDADGFAILSLGGG